MSHFTPASSHAMPRTSGTGILSAALISCLAMVGMLNGAQAQAESDADHAVDARGHGLSLHGQGFWPHWSGRIGLVVDKPSNPIKGIIAPTQSEQGGLQVHSLHVLSDYYIEGGFHATAGLLRGETGQTSWASGDTGGGLNLSLQRLDRMGLVSTTAQQTMPYVGAGYSSRLSVKGAPNPWRFNADLGLITINSNNINRISQVFQGEKSLDELVHELRLRPIVKVSVGYSF